MALLKIIKLSSGVWKHNSDIDGDFILSNFYAKQENQDFLIVEVYGAKRRKYKINEIEVYNIGGVAETFASFDLLFIRLKELAYTAFGTSANITGTPNRVAKFSATNNLEASSLLFDDGTKIYSESDLSNVEPTNKLIYAQRKYVDNANSYSTNETPTGGTWIDGKPIYRKVLTKIVNNQLDSIPFDFEDKEIIKQEILFQDYNSVGNGHYNQFLLGTNDLRAYLFPDDNALRITNIATDLPSGKFYETVKVIAIIEYTKTTD